ncbi:MAG: 50S ribosomal protein L15e [TACK group archaeon]|nr:50S ribosomal protein L15e [TACK group archaeon]
MPSLAQYRAETFKRELRGDLSPYQRSKLVDWRNEENVVKLERPTRIDRARELGYKAKSGFIVARSAAKKGGFFVPRPRAARRPKNMGIRLIRYNLNAQTLAERKAAEKFPGLEVLGSYYVGEDGKHKWFEVLLADPHNPSVLSDKERKWIANPSQKGRVFRGLTAAGKRSRGLRNKASKDGFRVRVFKHRKAASKRRRTNADLIRSP